MNGELLKRLVKSYTAGDDEAFLAAARQIVQSELKQGHTILADEIQRILAGPTQPRRSGAVERLPSQPPRSKIEGASLVDVRRTSRTLSDIILAPQPESRILRFLQEYSSQARLAEFGLAPKRKLLFYGPPGNGKTLCAEVIAGELSLPLIYVRFDSLVASYLGETSANLRRVFEFATSTVGILFFDEFDAIGKTRDDRDDVGELKRVVNSFLQLLDGFQSKGALIAATNYERSLDYALWRRFDDLIFFPMATEEQLTHYISTRLQGFRFEGFEPSQAARWCEGCSFSDVARITTEAIKTMILEGGSVLHAEAYIGAIEQHRAAQTQRQWNIDPA